MMADRDAGDVYWREKEQELIDLRNAVVLREDWIRYLLAAIPMPEELRQSVLKSIDLSIEEGESPNDN